MIYTRKLLEGFEQGRFGTLWFTVNQPKALKILAEHAEMAELLVNLNHQIDSDDDLWLADKDIRTIRRLNYLINKEEK